MFIDLLRSTKTKHTRLPQQDSDSLDSEALLSSSSSATSLPLKAPFVDRSGRDLKVAVKTLILSSVVYLGVGLWLLLSIRNAAILRSVDNICMDHVSRYSPVVRDVKPGWHDKHFNGSFLHQNEFRQSAGPEVDAAWAALGIGYRSVVVPLEEAEATGMRPEQVQVSEYYGGGFPANVEGLHHLHCLDLLRRTLHWNYDYYLAKKEGAFVNNEYIVRVHTTHCLDILRQVLMCNPDVGVLGQVWWQPENDSQPAAFVDFNTVHRCRDYEAVRAWAEAHQLPPEEQVDMSRFYKAPKAGDVLPEIP